ncbi:HD family hydrolase [Chloroflexota bacterium]
MDQARLVDLLLESATLKRMPRTGWVMRGVPYVESVADHSFGVVFVALTLVDTLQASGNLDGELDLEKVLIMALLHDLAEVRLTDLPASANHLIPGAVKSQAEAAAMVDLLAPLPAAHRLSALWQEFKDRATPEGRLVRDADKLEMMVQCLRYEQAGSRDLDDFWRGMNERQWHYPLCAGLYAHLKAMRPVGADREA